MFGVRNARSASDVVAQCGKQFGLVFGDQGARNLCEITFHDGTKFVERQVDPVVCQPPLGEVVSADAFGAIT